MISLRQMGYSCARPPGIMPRILHAPVAQLDRVVAFEAIGRGFESLRARQ